MTSIKKDQLKVSIIIVAVSVLLVSPRSVGASETSASTQGDLSPIIESVFDTFAFIGWVTSNPGGTLLHYAIVQYGTDPDHLDRTAKSPSRVNPAHGEMIFRVRVNDLQPGTTYYYRVSSQQANGAADRGTSAIHKFTTRAVNQTTSQ
jgi:hypothetical protein